MVKTIFLLIIAVIVIPAFAFYFDDPLTGLQLSMIKTSAIMMLCIAAYCFIVSEISRNYSQVDKLWSIVPIIYTWYFSFAANWDTRLVLMAVLVTLWGARLTYNFNRRGAYVWPFWEGKEDYRWGVLRSQPPLNKKINWTLFNLFFISFYQNTLIWLFTLPAVMAASSNATLGWVDYLLAVIFILLLIMETIADQQQWNYQLEKHRRIKSNDPLTNGYEKGFTHTGLWKWMRHPNYTAEQGIWLVFYFFTVAATGKWINWSLSGAVLLLLLFQGSSDFSEKISASKYPSYKDYQRKTGRFLPRLF